MTPIKFQEAFERELNVFYKIDEKPVADTVFYWLNQAVLKFVKTRYSGTNAKTTAFEQNQKRIDDLRTLIKQKLYKWNSDDKLYGDQTTGEFFIILPDDYLFQIGTRIGIYPNNTVAGAKNPHLHCWAQDSSGNYVVRYTDAIEVTHETLDRELENSLSERHMHYCSAKPLKLTKGDKLFFYTDEYYQPNSVRLDYIRNPKAITLEQPFVNYDELPEHTHQEIVKLAVHMYLESTADQRYTSYSNEVNTME